MFPIIDWYLLRVSLILRIEKVHVFLVVVNLNYQFCFYLEKYNYPQIYIDKWNEFNKICYNDLDSHIETLEDMIKYLRHEKI